MRRHLPILLVSVSVLFGLAPRNGSAALVGQWTFETGEDLIDVRGNFPDLVLKGDAQIAEGKLDLNGSGTTISGWAVTDSALGAYSGPALTSKTLMAWAILQGLNDVAVAGSLITLDRITGDHFDGIIFGERQANRWMNGSSGWQRTADFDPGLEEASVGSLHQIAITYEHLGGGGLRVTGYYDGIPIGTYETGNASSWNTGDAEILFGVRHGSTAGGPGAIDALLEEARVYDTALTSDEIAAIYTAGPVVLVDSDADGLRDDWEMQNFGGLQETAGGDPDGDGVTNAEELAKRTNPKATDTDNDGLSDRAETKTGVYVDATNTGTDPTKPDTDGDGLKDGVETNTGTFVSATHTGTSPLLADTDGDRQRDGDEVTAGTDPTNPRDPATTLDDLLVGHWTFETGSELVDLTGNFPNLLLKGDATVADGHLDLNGAGTTATGWAVTDSTAGGYSGPPITNKSLAVWVRLQGLDSVAKAGSAMTLDRVNGDLFDGIIFAERQANRWMNGSSGWQRTADFVPGALESSVGALTHLVITYQHLGGGQLRVTGYRNGELIGQYETGNASRWEPGDAEVLFGVRHGSVTSGPGALDALLEEASLYRVALTQQQISLLANLGPADSSPLLAHWTFEPGQELADLRGNFPNLLLKGNARVVNGQLDVNGAGTSITGWAVTDTVSSSYGGPPIQSKTLVAWAKLESLSDLARAGSLLTVDRISGDQFDGIVFAERQPNQWMNGSSFFARTQDFSPGWEETSLNELFCLAITYQYTEGGTILITGYRNTDLLGQYEVGALSSWETGDAEAFFGVRHGTASAGGPGALDARIEEARIYGGALSAERIAELVSKGPIIGLDRDADGLPDAWEMQYFGDLDETPNGDPDADQLPNLTELQRETNPNDADTDNDGLSDGVETMTGVFVSATDTGTDPVRDDSDGDGLKDGVENPLLAYDPARPQAQPGTDPNRADSDQDRVPDGTEIAGGTNPTDSRDPVPPPISTFLVGRWTFEPGYELSDRTGNFPDLALKGDAQVAEGKLDVNGAGTAASGWAVTDSDTGTYAGPPITDKTLVVWAVMQGLEDIARAGSLMTLDRVSGDHFDGIIFGERQPNRWMNGSSGFGRTLDFDPGFEETEIGVPFQLAITYQHLAGGNLRVTGYRNGQQIGQYEAGNASSWPTGDAEVFFGLRHGNTGGGPGGLDALIEEARLYRQALLPFQIAELYANPLDLSIVRAGNAVRIEWYDAAASLESAPSITGPWTPIPNASPYEEAVAAGTRRFFRLKK